MSYTPPSASAADATWLGAAAYTPPSAAAADATFASGNFASGFSTTQIGAPTSRRTQPATGFLTGNFGTPIAPYFTTGFKSTQFGTPYGVFDQFGTATGFKSTVLSAHSTPLPVTGFCSTHIGTPYGVFWQITQATGFKPTQFGPIKGWQHWDEVWNPPATKFGTPTTPTNRTAQAAGFQSTRYGQPGKVSHKPDGQSWLCIASGFDLVRIGSPVATRPQFGSVSGIAAVHLGTPKGTRGQRATGIHSTVIGAPTVKTLLKASGFASGHLGLAVAMLTQRADGAQFVQRFGLPESDIGNTHKVYGINASGRIGNPAGFSRFNYRVTGFQPVAIGSASCHESHRASHVTPICRIGTPILKRNTQC